MRDGLARKGNDVGAVLRTFDTGLNRRPLVYRDGRGFARTPDPGLDPPVPQSLRRVVARGVAGIQRVKVDGATTLIVGVPVPDGSAEYYELTSQAELEGILRGLAGTMFAVALLTTAAAAALGLWASRRILRPLTTVTGTARTIASGDLSARLAATEDPDLAPLTESFNDMVVELQARIERDRRFAGDVSHELRSPLQTLTAAATVLANRRDGLDPRAGAATDLVVAEVDRFSTLVIDLLELARGDEPVDLTAVPLATLVREVCRAASVCDDTVEVDPGLTWPVDRRRLERIVTNLVQNAERHGGGVTRIACFVRENELHLLV